MVWTRIILPASILAGTIIGAGMFSLPFVFQEAGFLTGLIYLAAFAAIYILVYWLYADLILRTYGEHRLVGYARIYFGNAGFWPALFVGLIQLFFVLTIYLILAPSFSGLIFSGESLNQLLIFWIIGSLIILFNTRRIALLEFLMVAGIVLIIILIAVLGLKKFLLTANFQESIDWSRIFVAGPILFALSGSLAVPEVVSYFKESSAPFSFLKKSLALSSVLPALAYAAFVFGIWGLSGQISEDSVSGLIGRVPDPVLVFLGILGFLSLISSYIVVGLNARRILEYDLFLPGWLSRALVIFTPPALYFSGFQNFIYLVSFVGLLFLPLENLLIIFMWLKADKISDFPPIIAGNLVRKTVPVLILIFMGVLGYVIINIWQK